jgi:electron transfer flavoprotein beta subunit
MKVVACYKVVPEEQDLVTNPDRSFDMSKAELKLGEYDLNAIEAAVQLVETSGGTVSLLTAGSASIDNSKLIKAALSRGAEDLHMVIDEQIANMDAYQTGSLLAKALDSLEFDLVICGEGSADIYAQQVGCQLGELLGIPCVNAVSQITCKQQGSIIVERTLEREIEILEVDLPAVIAVTTDINLPRIPQLKDILSAGKKETHRYSCGDLGFEEHCGIEVISTLAPESVERKRIVLDGVTEENLDLFVQSIKQEW